MTIALNPVPCAPLSRRHVPGDATGSRWRRLCFGECGLLSYVPPCHHHRQAHAAHQSSDPRYAGRHSDRAEGARGVTTPCTCLSMTRWGNRWKSSSCITGIGRSACSQRQHQRGDRRAPSNRSVSVAMVGIRAIVLPRMKNYKTMPWFQRRRQGPPRHCRFRNTHSVNDSCTTGGRSRHLHDDVADDARQCPEGGVDTGGGASTGRCTSTEKRRRERWMTPSRRRQTGRIGSYLGSEHEDGQVPRLLHAVRFHAETARLSIGPAHWPQRR